MRHTSEQQNLLWGSEVTTYLPGRPGRPARTVRVEEEHIGFATALALVLAHGRRERNCQMEAHCPRCGRRGSTEQEFGTRWIKGQRRPQSWCRLCRSARASRTEETQPAAKVAHHPPIAEPGWLFEEAANSLDDSLQKPDDDAEPNG
jgi:hypothetical protein